MSKSAVSSFFLNRGFHENETLIKWTKGEGYTLETFTFLQNNFRGPELRT